MSRVETWGLSSFCWFVLVSVFCFLVVLPTLNANTLVGRVPIVRGPFGWQGSKCFSAKHSQPTDRDLWDRLNSETPIGFAQQTLPGNVHPSPSTSSG